MKFWILNHVLFQFVFFPSWNLPCWATWSGRQSTIQWPDYKFFRRLHTSIDESRIEMTKENNLGIRRRSLFCWLKFLHCSNISRRRDFNALTLNQAGAGGMLLLCRALSPSPRPWSTDHLHSHPAEQDNVTHLSQWNDWWQDSQVDVSVCCLERKYPAASKEWIEWSLLSCSMSGWWAPLFGLLFLDLSANT